MTTTVDFRRVVVEVGRSLRAAPIFAFYLLATLGIAGVVGLMTFNIIDVGMSHFGSLTHRIHDLAFGFIFSTSVVGLLTQFRRPSKNVAGMVMALVPWFGLLLAAILSADLLRVVLFNPSMLVIPMTVIVILLHPTGRNFLSSVRLSRANWIMLALVVVAAVPLLVFASTNIGLQATVADEHAIIGHYGFIAAFSFTAIGVGLLASLRPNGWRLTAWVAGLLPALFGLASIVYPVTSGLSVPWATASIAWGVGFVAVAERTLNGTGAALVGLRRVGSPTTRVEGLADLRTKLLAPEKPYGPQT